MAEHAASLCDLLSGEPIGEDVFRFGVGQEPWGRVYGGQLVGQAIAAAGATAPPSRALHSTHAYFLRPPDPALPTLFHVERLLEGRRFAVRRISGFQGERRVLELSASYHAPEDGWSHSLEMPKTPSPFELDQDRKRVFAVLQDLPARVGPPDRLLPAIDYRLVDDPSANASPFERYIWLRVASALGNEARQHEAILAYVSDFSLIGAVLAVHRHNPAWAGVEGGSLDHAMWIHAPFRADDWILYVQQAPWSGSARGFARGSMFSQDGRLIAHMAQEALIRPNAPPQQQQSQEPRDVGCFP